MSLTLFILFYNCVPVMDWLLQTNRRFTLQINPDFRDFDVRGYLSSQSRTRTVHSVPLTSTFCKIKRFVAEAQFNNSFSNSVRRF